VTEADALLLAELRKIITEVSRLTLPATDLGPDGRLDPKVLATIAAKLGELALKVDDHRKAIDYRVITISIEEPE
jgi:hypothetical protein